jgi:hypothetical protein
MRSARARCESGIIALMPHDAERLRTHAAQLLAFAMNARESGQSIVADHFTARAAQCLDEAEAIERRAGGLITDKRRQSAWRH